MHDRQPVLLEAGRTPSANLQANGEAPSSDWMLTCRISSQSMRRPNDQAVAFPYCLLGGGHPGRPGLTIFLRRGGEDPVDPIQPVRAVAAGSQDRSGRG